MWRAIEPVFQVLLGIILLEGALGILSPIVGIQLAADGVEAGLIGLVSSAYFVGFLLGTLVCYRMIDRVGHIRTFGVLAVCAANFTLLLTMMDGVIAWAIIRGLTGFALAGVFVVIESWLTDKASDETRSRIFAVYMVLSWAAGGISPLSLNFTDPEGIILIQVAAMLMAAAMIPVALTKVGNPQVAHREHFGIIRLFAISPTGVVCCFGSGMLNGALYSLLPPYLEEVGFSPEQLSFLLSSAVLAALLTQYPVGHIADHYGRRPMIIGTMIASTVVSIVIAMQVSGDFLWLMGAFFCLVAFESPLYALGVGQTTDYIDRKDFVAAASGLLFAWGVGATIGPASAGIVMQHVGPGGLFYYMAAGFGAIALFAVYRAMRRRAKTPEEQSNYVATPNIQTVYGAPELDPRGEFQPHAEKPAREGYID